MSNMNKKFLTAFNIASFQKYKELVLNDFESKMLLKTPKEKADIVLLLNNHAEKMVDYGFDEDVFYHPMKKRLNAIGLSDEEARAVMFSYQLSSPNERKTLQNNILTSTVRLVSEQVPFPTDWREMITETNTIAQTIIEEKEAFTSLPQKIVGPQKKPHLALLQQFQMMTPERRQKVVSLLEKSEKFSDTSNIHVGIARMDQMLSPFFLKDSNNIRMRMTQDMMAILKYKMYVFGFMFLIQAPWERVAIYSRIEPPKTPVMKSKKKRKVPQQQAGRVRG